MRWYRPPPQINRVVLLVFIIVVSYLAARTLLTPASFGEYGFYRGDSLRERAAAVPVFAGRIAYGKRYPEILATLENGGHKTLSCEACHGPISEQQLADPEYQPAKLAVDFCMRCHEVNPTRPAAFKQIDAKDHYEGECLECHLPHLPAEAPEEEPAK